MKKTLLAFALCSALPVAALAQSPVTQTESVEVTAQIVAIDKAARTVTLKGEMGRLETVTCGPEVERFEELKVGDKVTFRYYESMAFAIRKPGAPSGLPADAGRKVVRSAGAKPGATISEQETATVTVKALDAKVPSITVLTEDNREASFKVEKAEYLKDVKVGDKVEITYTKAFMVSIK